MNHYGIEDCPDKEENDQYTRTVATNAKGRRHG